MIRDGKPVPCRTIRGYRREGVSPLAACLKGAGVQQPLVDGLRIHKICECALFCLSPVQQDLLIQNRLYKRISLIS